MNIDPSHQIIVNTQASQTNLFQLIPQHSLAVMLQAARLSLITRISDKNITEFLKTEIEKVEQLSLEFKFDGSHIISNIPLSKTTLMQRLGFDVAFSKMICCPDCFKLYPIPEIPKKDDESTPEVTTTCTTVFYSTSKKFLKEVENEEQLCEAKVADVEGSGTKMIIKPVRTFTFQTLKNWLSYKLWLPGFECLADSNLKYQSREDGRKCMEKLCGTFRLKRYFYFKIWKSCLQSLY
jgi:hypothetical protein